MLPADKRDRVILAVVVAFAGMFGGKFADVIRAAAAAALGAY